MSFRWCTRPATVAAALAHRGSWTDKDCPRHVREAQDEMNDAEEAKWPTTSSSPPR